MSNTLDLAKELISRPSVTPDDQGCQTLIADYLKPLGFEIEPMRFGEVDNLWARYGTEGPLFVFAGHTDVVPTGPAEQWTFPPFKPTLAGETLYGRGSADMKSSIAAMMVACKALIESGSPVKGSIGFLITSDEEGPATDGTVRVIETLEARNEKIDWCLVGEPSSTKQIGDVIKNGRRGSISGNLTIHGQQGHIAYPHLAENPIHTFVPVLNELVNEHWDHGNDSFPPTSFQISNINAGTGATNVIPGDLEVLFNLRFSTELKHTEIQSRIEAILNKHQLKYTLDWSISGQPFLTPGGKLVSAAQRAIKNICGIDAQLSTAGGTSDGRFIAPTGAQVVELGPINESIHKIDENVNINDLEALTKIYKRILIDLVT
ncbi:MAG: succinyl-diaminopimelate desuccinylase [Gammaproteobacteria bacterium]|nr:succinyl-diaminopimelate desuccinylase [Gammaproteobacteria bacterium]